MDVTKKVPVREQAPDVRNKNFDEVCLGYNEEEAVLEASRCINCKNAQCIKGCPVSINIPAFIHEVKEKNFEAAYKIIGQSSALPAVCGRVCPQESQCEGKCIRGIKGEAISIGKLERFVADWARQNQIKPEKSTEKKNKKVESNSPALLIANEIINVMDIDDKFLYTRDGYIISFLKIGNINMELMGEDELKNMTMKLALSFESDKGDFDYFTLPSQVNLDPNKEYLRKKHQEIEDVGRRKGLDLMLQEMTRLSTSGENYEHQHYIKIWRKIGSNIKDTQNEQYIRLMEFRDRYVMAGIPCEVMKDREIIKMCNVFGNPLQAPFTSGVISRYEAFPIMKG